MTSTQPNPVTKNAAQQRLELGLLLKQPVLDPRTAARSLPLLNALNEISPERLRDLQGLPIGVDEHRLEIAIPSQWGEKQWQVLINQLPSNGQTIPLHPTLHGDLIRALTPEPSKQRERLVPNQEGEPTTDDHASLEEEASSFL